jgi:hypothetical protein
MRSLTVSEFVRHCTLDGRVVVLDLRVGTYLVFDAVASTMWNIMLTSVDESDRVERLAADFDVSSDRVRKDLAAFARSCAERNLVSDPAASVVSESAERVSGTNARARPPTIFHAWQCLYTTRRTLARRGFSCAYQRIYDLPKAAGDPDGVRLRAALRAFSRAENFFPAGDARIDCLPRSLALLQFVRSVGIGAEHCIGVRRFPFGAHAWVEVAGTVVHDSPAFVRDFHVIART